MRSLLDFGGFQLDLNRYELRRDGRVLRLERIPMDLLVFLLEHRERLVTREEIASQIWGDGVFIDVDNGINTAIRKIRNVLKDDPLKPRFIETVPGKGYRFVAEVAVTEGIGAESLVTPPSMAPAPPEPPAFAMEGSFHSEPNQRSQWRRLFSIGLVTILFLSATAVSGIFWKSPAYLRVSQYIPLTSDTRDKGGPLFTDGVRVYFQQKGSNHTTLAAVAVDGGGTGFISLPKRYETIYDLSPFRSEFLGDTLRSDQEGGDFWIFSLLGGSPRQIGNLHGRAAKWSPDGKQIAFVLEQNLYISDADGAQEQKLAEIGKEIQWLRWSPDGKLLRFTKNEYQKGEVLQSIWEIGTDGKNLHRILDGWNRSPHECCGMWTPDGKFFIFEATRDGRTDLWALPERTGFSQFLFGQNARRPIRLTSGLQGYLSPLVSTDGKRVFAVGIEKRGELVRYDSTLQNFVPFLGGISATWVTFSKSSHSVAYISYPEKTLWRANADGSEKAQITFAPLEVDGFDWSPDEKWFALRARNPGRPWMIYLVPSHGGEPQPMMPSEIEQGVPTWSPDGKTIAFGDVPEVFGKPSGREIIHIFDLKTHKLSALPGSRKLWTVRWSPDGALLAALRIEDGKLMLYDFEKQRWRSTHTMKVNNLNWSPDSKYIYFDTTGDRALFRINVADGHVEQLTSLRNYPNLAWWWSGLAPDGSPLVLRNLGTNEIYSLLLEAH